MGDMSPQFGMEPLDQLMSAVQSKDKLQNISKLIFGGEKTFDLGDLGELENVEDEENEERAVSGGRDLKKKIQARKFMLQSDANLGKKVGRAREAAE